MHVHDTFESTEGVTNDSKGDLELVLEAYNECTRQQLSLQTSLMQLLDKREREAEHQLNTAREDLEHVRNVRQGISSRKPNLEESHVARSQNPNRMESTTWRWFHEHSEENGITGPDSILSDTSFRRPQRGLRQANMSQETIKERTFDYLRMKDEPSDDCITFTNNDQKSIHTEDLYASVELTASLGSLASSLRSNLEHPVVAPTPLGIGMEHHLSPLVTVKRESLVTLLNAFDHILLNGAL